MNEMMGKEEWIQWFITEILPSPYNEWGISREEFIRISGWNDCRQCILQRLVNNKEKEVKE